VVLRTTTRAGISPSHIGRLPHAVNILGSVAIVRSTDREVAVSRYRALFGAPPLHEFPITDRELHVAVFPVIGAQGEEDALAPLTDLRATLFVGSLRDAEVELRRSG